MVSEHIKHNSLSVANIIEEGKLGGPQIRIVIAAAALKGRVHTTVIMPVANSEAFQQRCKVAGVDYKVMPISRITKEWRVALRYVFFSLFEIFRIVLFLRQGVFDVVHVSGGSWQYKGVIAGKLAGKKILWHLNDTSMPGIFRKVFSLISPLADGYIFASERSKEYYQSFLPSIKNEFIIPAPVDTEKFNPEGEYQGDEDLLEEWQSNTVIGIVANINPIKGLETFIEAAAIVNKQCDYVRFVVVGPVFANQKRYDKKLQLMCDSLSLTNIEFVGGRSDIRPLLQRFDLYVCSSKAESSPISVWEAMAMAKPIVSTDVGDVPLYVRNGTNGFIVNINDSEAMAKQLSKLVFDKELRQKFGMRNREVAVRELDITLCAEKHLNAYNSIINARSCH